MGSPRMNDLPFVSVIIPTYNRGKYLPITLDSFINQSYPKDRLEIIVANNNSTDNTKEIMEDYCERVDNMGVVFEGRQGVHYARNSAAKIAQGDILYFTDDDMIADKDLLLEIVKPFLVDASVGAVTGRVLPKWEATPPDWILKYCNNGLLSLNNQGEDLRITDYDPGVWSCHQAVLRDVFFESGGFNPENTAGEWIGDGETGLNIKIKVLGFKFAYNGKSVIYHIIPPSRMTQAYLNKRFANQGNCDSYTEFRKHKYGSSQLIMQILMHVKNIFILIFKIVLGFFLVKDFWRVLTARIFYNINRIKYDFRLMHDEQWRKLVLKENWLEEL
jgi:glucosyl-dolichyl phosphate glucuronosyltransferase